MEGRVGGGVNGIDQVVARDGIIGGERDAIGADESPRGRLAADIAVLTADVETGAELEGQAEVKVAAGVEVRAGDGIGAREAVGAGGHERVGRERVEIDGHAGGRGSGDGAGAAPHGVDGIVAEVEVARLGAGAGEVAEVGVAIGVTGT